ncbi:unnamed protein product [Amoebophrya sp. A25]|nr:unnamed protein product [Amoebophrya sp. A25]|eukprot:GSA25T00006606001.1
MPKGLSNPFVNYVDPEDEDEPAHPAKTLRQQEKAYKQLLLDAAEGSTLMPRTRPVVEERVPLDVSDPDVCDPRSPRYNRFIRRPATVASHSVMFDEARGPVPVIDRESVGGHQQDDVGLFDRTTSPSPGASPQRDGNDTRPDQRSARVKKAVPTPVSDLRGINASRRVPLTEGTRKAAIRMSQSAKKPEPPLLSPEEPSRTRTRPKSAFLKRAAAFESATGSGKKSTYSSIEDPLTLSPERRKKPAAGFTSMLHTNTTRVTDLGPRFRKAYPRDWSHKWSKSKEGRTLLKPPKDVDGVDLYGHVVTGFDDRNLKLDWSIGNKLYLDQLAALEAAQAEKTEKHRLLRLHARQRMQKGLVVAQDYDNVVKMVRDSVHMDQQAVAETTETESDRIRAMNNGVPFADIKIRTSGPRYSQPSRIDQKLFGDSERKDFMFRPDGTRRLSMDSSSEEEEMERVRVRTAMQRRRQQELEEESVVADPFAEPPPEGPQEEPRPFRKGSGKKGAHYGTREVHNMVKDLVIRPPAAVRTPGSKSRAVREEAGIKLRDQKMLQSRQLNDGWRGARSGTETTQFSNLQGVTDVDPEDDDRGNTDVHEHTREVMRQLKTENTMLGISDHKYGATIVPPGAKAKEEFFCLMPGSKGRRVLRHQKPFEEYADEAEEAVGDQVHADLNKFDQLHSGRS